MEDEGSTPTMNKDHKINIYNSTHGNTSKSNEVNHSMNLIHHSWSHHPTCQERVMNHLNDGTSLNASIPYYFFKNDHKPFNFTSRQTMT